MSQFGMQMPGGMRRGPSINVYTGLMAIATIALAAACLYLALGPGAALGNGNPFAVRESDAKGR